ncbi:MAG: hypothetical protein AABX60_01570 [Nanoarchaeota archaeon]
MVEETAELVPEELARKKRSVDELLKQKILVSPEFLASVGEEIKSEELKRIAQNGSESGLGVLVIDKDVGKLLKRNESGVNWL